MALPWDPPPGIINWAEEAEKHYRMAFSREMRGESAALALRRAEVAAQIGLLETFKGWVFDPRVRKEP